MHSLCTIYEISDDRHPKKKSIRILKMQIHFQNFLRIITYKSKLLWSHSVMVLVMTEFFLCKNKLKHFWRLKYFVLTIVVLLLWPQKKIKMVQIKQPSSGFFGHKTPFDFSGNNILLLRNKLHRSIHRKHTNSDGQGL